MYELHQRSVQSFYPDRKYSHVNGFYKNEDGGDFDGSQQVYQRILKENGYETAVIGKWHLGSSPTGFDYYKVLFNKEGQGSYYNPVFESTGELIKEETGKYSTYVIKDDAINWLKNREHKEKPFLLMYQFKAPHRPCDPAPEYMDYLQGVTLPHPVTYEDDYEGRPAAADAWNHIDGHMNRKDLKLHHPEGLDSAAIVKWNEYGNNDGEFWTPDPEMTDAERKDWKFQTYVKDYLRCIKAVDDAVGEMLEYLEESGQLDNTIIVYTSDQGFFLGEHGGWFDKRFMYEETFHMPCMIRYPKEIKAGTINDDLLLNIDFAPTLLDYAGIEIPEDIQGKSFRNAINGKCDQYETRDAIYYHYYEFPFWHHVQPHYGICTERYKLIHFYYSMDVWELYDLKEDPYEMNNLYGKEGYEELTASLKTRLGELQQEFGMTKTHEELRGMTDAKIERRYVKEPAN